ncbi:MAG: hypothetical protein ACRDPY_48970 [Streptosporangiaceae bacterium]
MMLPAAYELHCRATARSAANGHAGFVPDEYLAAPGTETAISAAGLCATGLWERAGDGYRVLDGEAAGVCPGRVRELREGEARARARGQQSQAQMAQAMVAVRRARYAQTSVRGHLSSGAGNFTCWFAVWF